MTKRVRDSGPSAKRVSQAEFARALGAEPVGKTGPRSPISMAGIYRELSERLRSSGGRPALEGADRRQKIPITEADWEALERLSETLSAGGTTASPGQVASVLLHQAVNNLDPADAKALFKKRA